MYGLPDPPEPKYWKALLMAALFGIPLSSHAMCASAAGSG